MEPTSPCIRCQGQPTPPPCYTCTFRLKHPPPGYDIIPNNDLTLNTQSNYSVGQSNYTSPSSTWYHNNTLTMPSTINNGHPNNYSNQNQNVMFDSHSNAHQHMNYNEGILEDNDPFNNEVTMMTERMTIHDTGAQHSQEQGIGSWNNGIYHNIQISLEVPLSRRRNPSGNQLLLSAISPPNAATTVTNSQHHIGLGDIHGGHHSSRIESALPSQGIIPY